MIAATLRHYAISLDTPLSLLLHYAISQSHAPGRRRLRCLRRHSGQYGYGRYRAPAATVAAIAMFDATGHDD